MTHALVCSLSEDRKLLHEFVRWVTGRHLRDSDCVKVIEQQLPEEPETSEEEAERRGLPDAWIYDPGGKWAILIECKIASPVSHNQLNRHMQIAKRYAFEETTYLLIGVSSPNGNLDSMWRYLNWTEVYAFVKKYADRSEWAYKFTTYVEIAESKMIDEQYLKEGTLTMFTGIPFSPAHPYTYLEAKRLMRLLTAELRKRSDLVSELGMNPTGNGRGALTSAEDHVVWDYIPLKCAAGEDSFTSYPHLTVDIHQDTANGVVTVPNGVRPEIRRKLIDLGDDGFTAVLMKVVQNANPIMEIAHGASPKVVIMQRHYPSQRSKPIYDGRMEFDPRTLTGNGAIKTQPQWGASAYEILQNRKGSNIQFQVGVKFPYATCPEMATPKAVDLIAKSWLACRPLLDVLLN